MSTASTSQGRILPIIIGNIFEWFDFALYGFFATTIAKQFFPAGDSQAAMLATAATFGAAFLMRPVGALVFGLIGDRIGRKVALTATISLMAVGTALIALAPTYASAGIAATLILVTGRLLQGFSAAGEAGVAMALLIESTEPQRRGVAGGWLGVGVYGAIVLGSLAGLAVNSLLTPADAESWGWRVPFLAGLLIVPAGLYLRRGLAESEEFLLARSREATHDNARNGAAHGSMLRGIFSMIGLAAFGSSVVYLVLIFMPGYAARELAMPQKVTMLSTFLASTLLVLLLVPTGWLSDRIGRKRMLGGACLIAVVTVVPLFMQLNRAPSLLNLLLLQAVLSACLAAYASSAAALMASLFPVDRRALGIGMGYNVGILIFGAFAPFITTWLVGITGDKLVPAYYVAGGALLSLLVVLCLREPDRSPALPMHSMRAA